MNRKINQMIDNKKTSDYIKQNQDAVERQYDKGGHSFIIIYYQASI